jgi:hypothetical protein
VRRSPEATERLAQLEAELRQARFERRVIVALVLANLMGHAAGLWPL